MKLLVIADHQMTRRRSMVRIDVSNSNVPRTRKSNGRGTSQEPSEGLLTTLGYGDMHKASPAGCRTKGGAGAVCRGACSGVPLPAGGEDR